MEGKSKKFALNPWGREAEEGNEGCMFSIPSEIAEETTDLCVCVCVRARARVRLSVGLVQ